MPEAILVACPKPTEGRHAEMILEATPAVQARLLTDEWDGGRAALLAVEGLELRCVETERVGLFEFRQEGEPAPIFIPEPPAWAMSLAGLAMLAALAALGGRMRPRGAKPAKRKRCRCRGPWRSPARMDCLSEGKWVCRTCRGLR